jgi:IS5 family transposase
VIEATVFRTISGPVAAWESLLPPRLLRLPEELARVDALLDDPAFFVPFAPYFHPVLGRASTPAGCYLRLMFLKFRYRLGYESSCAEVSDSISWRRFCRIGLDGTVPHPTTLMKLTTKGRIGRPVEFGYKAQVIDNDDGVIMDYGVQADNPPDAPQLPPAISRIARRTGTAPGSVTADRGYGEPATERDLQALGVRTIAIPRRAKTSHARRAVEHARRFRALVKWRTGSEGRISYLKRGYGWDRTRLDGREGASIWCGHGVFAHNLVKISALAS